MSTDTTDLDQMFQYAVKSEIDDAAESGASVAALATLVTIWRSRASYWHGKFDGMAETVAYLKERIKVLEGIDNDDHSTFDDKGNRVEVVR